MAEPTNIPGGIPMRAHLTMRAAWQQVEGEAPGWRSRPSEVPEEEPQRSPEKMPSQMEVALNIYA